MASHLARLRTSEGDKTVGNTTYSTKNNGNASIVYLGDGAITIDELDSVNGTVT